MAVGLPLAHLQPTTNERPLRGSIRIPDSASQFRILGLASAMPLLACPTPRAPRALQFRRESPRRRLATGKDRQARLDEIATPRPPGRGGETGNRELSRSNAASSRFSAVAPFDGSGLYPA